MLKYFVEFIGTFIFLAIILSSKKPIAVGVGLLALIYFGGHISGAHFNPAVSIMMFLNKSLSSFDLPIYIGIQIFAGVCAYYFVKASK